MLRARTTGPPDHLAPGLSSRHDPHPVICVPARQAARRMTDCSKSTGVERAPMKVVLFCGGPGTRIRDYSEAVPKPMVPVGQHPILWHVMQYYSAYGHRDFVLCLGYKADTIKDFFLDWRRQSHADMVISDAGQRIEILGEPPPDWRVSLVDTGLWRNVGQRLVAVREHVKDEPMFLANYSDGLSDAPLPEMIRALEDSGKVGCFLAVRPPLTFHLVEFDGSGNVVRMRASADSDIWINAGYFVFTNRIFDYIGPNEDLVIEPFQRLIDEGQLLAYRYTGFFRPMDTLKDKQILEDMVESGDMPWEPHVDGAVLPGQ
jgi:glucose-1-phosphate cytidylyltransferase